MYLSGIRLIHTSSSLLEAIQGGIILDILLVCSISGRYANLPLILMRNQSPTVLGLRTDTILSFDASIDMRDCKNADRITCIDLALFVVRTSYSSIDIRIDAICYPLQRIDNRRIRPQQLMH